jgi:hypothetical protein
MRTTMSQDFFKPEQVLELHERQIIQTHKSDPVDQSVNTNRIRVTTAAAFHYHLIETQKRIIKLYAGVTMKKHLC